MASFTAGTTFTDGVANDVTAAKLGALVTNATPTSGLIQDRTAETATATNDTLLIGDASDSNNLKRITVANFAQTLPTAKITTGTIDTGTFGTTTSTAAIITTGTITTGVIPTLTAGTTTGTAATITTGTIPTLVATTLITSGTGTAAAPAIVPTGDTNNGLFFPAADNIAVSTNGTERVRVDSSGNVGIGTASPTKKLQVVGPSANGAGNEAFWVDANSVQFAVRRDFGGGGTVEIGSPNFHNLGFFTNGTTKMVVGADGNVGIGTTSPNDLLDLQTPSSNYALRIRASSNNFALVRYVNNANNNIDAIIGTPAANTLALYTNGFNERLRIDSSGNVGIGATSPVNKLEIVGSFGRGAPVTKVADFTLADTENWLIVNKGSSCTVTLPAASSWTGREFTIKVITAHTVVSASSNVVPRNSATAGTAILAATAGSWATLVSNGTNWVIMCGS